MMNPDCARESEATRATRTERAGEAARERACRGVRRGEAPRLRLDGSGTG